MSKHVLLLVGGKSREKKVSEMSGESVYKALIELGYKVTKLNPDDNFINELINLKPDIIFNCLHGTFGEDGVIPGILEWLRIPYTHSGVKASAIAMDKIVTKNLAFTHNVNTPKHIEIKSEDLFDMLEKGIEPINYPYVIKPIDQGSTIGIYFIMDEKSIKPKRADWDFGEKILIEEYIPGQELSVLVFRDEPIGVLELKPKSNFYDYESKYIEGLTEHIYPAIIPKDIEEKVMEMALTMHKTIGCRTISRSDFRYDRNRKEVFFLELNTHPGFTELSIVPDIAHRNGISFKELVEQLIQDARCEIIM